MLHENECWLVGFDARDEYALIFDSLYNEHGELVEIHMPIPRRFTITMRKKAVFADYLRVGDPYAKLIFSERSAQLVRRDTRCCDSISWVPLDVLNRKGTKVADYQVPFRPMMHPVFDYVHAKYDYLRGTQVIEKIRQWVLDGSALPSLDLFYSDNYRWIVSQRFRDVIEGSGFTGFQFDPVWVWR
jgi:hypothetical protein